MALSWLSQLLQASFRGIPFVVEQSNFTTGNKTVLHEYPYADNPKPERLGRANQLISFTGFLVGDDCYLKRDLLAAAATAQGTGILIHPSLTFIPSAVLLSATFTERAQRGRVVECQLNFVAVDDIPLLAAFSLIPFGGTPELVAAAVTTMVAASSAAFVTLMNPASLVIGLVETTTNTLSGFASRLLSTDPAMIFNSLNGMQALTTPAFTLSRYIAGNVDTSANTVLAGIDRTLAPAALIAAATDAMLDNTVTARAGYIASVTAATAAAINPPAYLTAIYALTEAFRAVVNEPSDQIRLLSQLASFPSPATPLDDTATTSITDTTASACRKAILQSLALAASEYQADDAQEVNDILNLIVPFFDAEILYAADANDIATYNALIALRAAVVNDLQTRGSQLPSLITITETTNLPSVAVAYKLYQDATRDSDVVQRVDPIHPLFMPLSFQVLSS